MQPRPTRADSISSGETQAFVALGREALQQLAVLIRNSYLHDLSNEVFVEPLDKAHRALERILGSEGRFRLERTGEEFYVNGVRVRMELKTLQSYKYLLDELEKRDVGGFAFEPPASRDAFRGLLSVLARVRSSEDGVASVNSLLAEAGVTGIQALPVREDADEAREDNLDRRERAIQAYQQALDFIRDSISTVDSPAQINVRRAKRTVHKLVDVSFEEGESFSLAGLAAIKGHHGYTFNHMVNVCVLAIAFGQRLGLERRELARLGLSALYHDMGKLHIPLEILDSSTGLSDQAWAEMGNHTVYAARTLFPLVEQDPGMLEPILTALQHHFGYKGRGYPKLRVHTRQSLFARITAIVDTFDAMTTKRLYQKRYLPDEAIDVLRRGSGARYDALLVKAFINCMGIYPIGSTVRLVTGEIGVVVASHPEPDKLLRPMVKRVMDAAGQFTDVELLDLSHPSQSHRTIQRCVDPDELGINPAHFAV